MKYRRFQNVALTSIGLSCLFGFFTLLVQPSQWTKGLILGAGMGVCISCTATKEEY